MYSSGVSRALSHSKTKFLTLWHIHINTDHTVLAILFSFEAFSSCECTKVYINTLLEFSQTLSHSHIVFTYYKVTWAIVVSFHHIWMVESMYSCCLIHLYNCLTFSHTPLHTLSHSSQTFHTFWTIFATS